MSTRTITIALTRAEYDDLRLALLALRDNVLRRRLIADANGALADAVRERRRLAEIAELEGRLALAAGDL